MTTIIVPTWLAFGLPIFILSIICIILIVAAIVFLIKNGGE